MSVSLKSMSKSSVTVPAKSGPEPDKSKAKITNEEIQELNDAHPNISYKGISRGANGETVWKDRNGNLLPKPVKGKVETFEQKKQQARYETRGLTDYINSEEKNLPKDSEGGTDYLYAKRAEASRKPYAAGVLEARVKRTEEEQKKYDILNAAEKQAKSESYNNKK